MTARLRASFQDGPVDDEEAFDDEHGQDETEQDILGRLELPDANGRQVGDGRGGPPGARP
jgi:hypothetical protein